LEQVPIRHANAGRAPAVTLSGGVGELAYDALQGKPWPATTCYGDLGIELAQRLCSSPLFAPHLQRFTPSAGGRATVYGLLRHNTEVSGSTVFVSDAALLPLTDVPILASVSEVSTDEQLRAALALVGTQTRGACLVVTFAVPGAAAVRSLGLQLAELLRAQKYPPERPLTLLVRHNLGKALGNYVTQWGQQPRALVVIDEIAVRDAQYVHIGTPRAGTIPVSYYGLNA
jgi:ethanolamine utilization protein EutA